MLQYQLDERRVVLRERLARDGLAELVLREHVDARVQPEQSAHDVNMALLDGPVERQVAGAVGGVRAAGGGEQLDAREVAVRRRTVQRARALRIGEIRGRAALDELAQLVGLAVARALEQLAAIVLGRRRRLLVLVRREREVGRLQRERWRRRPRRAGRRSDPLPTQRRARYPSCR